MAVDRRDQHIAHTEVVIVVERHDRRADGFGEGGQRQAVAAGLVGAQGLQRAVKVAALALDLFPGYVLTVAGEFSIRRQLHRCAPCPLTFGS
jgi:hypothetical protein